MTTTEQLDSVVLHSLRLKGRATPPGLASATGLDEETVQSLLEKNAGLGLVLQRTGRISGWMLTPEGRSQAEAALLAEKSTVDASAAAERYDTEFLVLNDRFKQLCTDWQLGALDGFRATLDAVHHSNLELLTALASSIPRLATYGPRFTAAYDRVLAGDKDALLRPMAESYHDIWLELHEDLLLLLDRERLETD
ncbi:hypothetical protein SAMN05421504_108193 [Amycolatopsis xylanica]|uniref:Uncharacterized protein n=1 Tax=Amycolatopsis xylanica TaxID=589385 RepID=A0A1H3PFH9_9PSEU|nr:hypothetical protein [Amycolatopsis xylanica]SDY99904.1 hypothetical protein SAMN05421504_108193 [Amycolatopsis xylanica]